MKNKVKNKIKAVLVTSALILSAFSAILNADQSHSSNITMLETTFGTTNITRRTDVNRNGIYTIVLENSEIPNNLPENFEIWDYGINEDGELILNLVYVPLRISINRNNDIETERIRITTLFNRGNINERQFKYLMNQLNALLPNSQQVQLLEQEQPQELEEMIFEMNGIEYEESNIDLANMADEEWNDWINNLSNLNIQDMEEEEWQEWIRNLDTSSLSDERFLQLIINM